MKRMNVTEYTRLGRRGQIQRLRRAAEDALSRYGIASISLSLLYHAYHTTFTVTAPDGARYVLHILRPVDADLPEMERRIRVESELWWLDRVRVDLGMGVPIPVRTNEGDGVVSLALNDMEPVRLCPLFRWLDGRFFRDRLAPAHLEGVGRIIARLHEYSAHLHVPEWFDRPMVDATDAVLEEETALLFADHVSDHAARVMRRVLQQARRAQHALGGAPDNYGLIHADIHQRNYLFDHGAVRLIDFGDCGWGHYLYDLAVTLSELENSPRLDQLRTALLSGYRQERDLSVEQEALIDSFVLLREVQNLTWFVSARDDPNYRARAAQIAERVARVERQLALGASQRAWR